MPEMLTSHVGDRAEVVMMPKNVLVPTDFSSSAGHALDYACALASELGATVHLVNALGATLPEIPVALSDRAHRGDEGAASRRARQAGRGPPPTRVESASST